MTESGRWEITGETQDLMGNDKKTCIGKKKILVFYMGKSRGKSRGSKPIWVVHEYHPLKKNPQVYTYSLTAIDISDYEFLSTGYVSFQSIPLLLRFLKMLL